MEKRSHPRFRTRFEALCASARHEGAGVLADISYTGARLEGSSLRPELGTKIHLYVFIQPVRPFELAGEVVRSDASGFAIAYTVEDPEVQRLVDDVAALVCV